MRVSVRTVEWTCVAAVLVVFWVVFGQHVRAVRGQVEEAAIKTTLGALRTTIVLHHLQQQVQGERALDPQGSIDERNPFELLQRHPANYAGLINARESDLVLPGHWVFEPVCVCIGYRPTDPKWLASASGDSMLWFAVSSPPGPRMINAREVYWWQGNLLN